MLNMFSNVKAWFSYNKPNPVFFQEEFEDLRAERKNGYEIYYIGMYKSMAYLPDIGHTINQINLTQKIRFLKDNDNKAVDYFVNILNLLVANNKDCCNKFYICSVPTSDPNNIDAHGITNIAKILAEETGNIDGTNLFVRKNKKMKFRGAKDSDRTAKNAAVGLDVAEELAGKNVLLLDDVATSGESLEASINCLKAHQCKVVAIALSQTAKQNVNNRKSLDLEVAIREKLIASFGQAIENDQHAKENQIMNNEVPVYPTYKLIK